MNFEISVNFSVFIFMSVYTYIQILKKRHLAEIETKIGLSFLGELTPDMENFRSMIHMVMENHLDRYRPHFQFGWTGSPDIANSVAMDTLSVIN